MHQVFKANRNVKCFVNFFVMYYDYDYDYDCIDFAYFSSNNIIESSYHPITVRCSENLKYFITFSPYLVEKYA